MKKLFWILPLALIVAWAATTFFIGMNIEDGIDQFYENTVEQIAAMGAGSSPVAFNKKEFKKGFFSSEATTALEFASFPMSMFNITVKTKIHHGPLMFTPDGMKFGCSYALSTLDLSSLPEDSRKDIDKAFDGEEPLTVGLLTTFSQDFSMNVSMPPFKMTEEEFEDDSETKVRFAGMSGTLDGSSKPDSPATGSLSIGEFRMSNDKRGTSVSTAIAKGELDMTDVRDGQMVGGNASMVLPELKFKSETSEVVVKNIAMKSETEMDDSKGTLGGLFRMEFAGVTGTDESGMASGLIEQLSKGGYMEFAMEGWDHAALMKFNEASNRMSTAQNKMMGDMMGDLQMELDENGELIEPDEGKEEESAEEVDMEAAMAEMEEAGKEMFVAAVALFRPGMSMDWRVKLGDGEGRGDLNLGLSYAEGAKPGSEAKTVGELVNAIVLEADARIAKAMLPEGMGEAMLAGPIEQGMVEDRGSYFRATAELKNGKVSVNGTAMPIMEQFAPMMEQELSPDAIMEAMMGGMMGGGAGPDMEGGFPDAPDATPAPAPQ
jgi:uncharacterized protein YdgA (DUF945 family)